jgi:trk system potassium uptake protein TrkA
MRAIIIGAGKIGYQIADTLVKENIDVVVIDSNEQIVSKVNENLDVLAIHANGLIGKTLRELGVNGEDLVVAVTGSDEGNILACLSARHMGAGGTIARIRNPAYAKDLALTKESLSIDYVINPEKATAAEISRLLDFSPAGQIEEFAKGKVQMVELPVEADNPFLDMPLRDYNGFKNILIAAVSRAGELVIPKGDTVLRAEDNIFVVGKKPALADFCKYIGKTPKRIRDVMIMGGGRITSYLAEYLHRQGIAIKVIEKDPQRARELSEEIPYALVINGDGTDVELLQAENIAGMDAFVTVTGIDEENALMALLAKQLGAKKVVSKVNRQGYISLVENIGVDAVITPSLITASEVLRFIRGDKLVSLSFLLGGQAEIMEISVAPASSALNIPLHRLSLPRDVIITTIIRGEEIIVPHGNDRILENDRIIVICRASETEKVSRLFIGREGKEHIGYWNSHSDARTAAGN